MDLPFFLLLIFVLTDFWSISFKSTQKIFKELVLLSE